MKFHYFLILIFILSACTANVIKEVDKEGPFLVVKVIDGDTLDLENGATIRLSGINTPEKNQCYYQEAKAALTNLVLNKEVYLEEDITDKDKYGRLLRYVYIEDLQVSSYLVSSGYAKVFDKYASTTKRYDELKQEESSAISQSLGVWNCQETNECLYVGSKNSNKYYPPDCKYASRILPENKVCYQSEEEVEDLERTTGCTYS